MQKSIWNGICRLKNPSYPFRSLLLFHSTPCSFAKRRDKFVYDAKDEGRGGSGQPSKNYIRYVVRRKRADAKRALNDFLLKGSYTKQSVQDEWEAWYADTKRSSHAEVEDCSNDFLDHTRSNQSRRWNPNRTFSKKTKKNRTNCKKWTFVSDDEDMHSKTTFEGMFGDRCYAWPFRSRADSNSQGPMTGFQWRDRTYWSNNGRCESGTRERRGNSNATKNTRRWESESDFESEDEHYKNEVSLGLPSQRTILGLPLTGPLKIDDIKTAFRASALKWHPDKHQGPSQTMAAEKFKLCVEAYHSLCSSLSSP